jgi:hypothetical protein
VVAAEAAALQWSFSPNFGLQSESQAGPLKYAWGVLIFNFALDEPEKDAFKRD